MDYKKPIPLLRPRGSYSILTADERKFLFQTFIDAADGVELKPIKRPLNYRIRRKIYNWIRGWEFANQ